MHEMFRRAARTCFWALLLLAAVLISAEALQSPENPLAPYPLEKKVQDLIRQCAAVKNWKPSGVDEGLYADLSEPIVRQAAAWQDETGRIIDPFVHTETPTATPRFVGALAGEMLKKQQGIADNRAFIEGHLATQISRFTPFGMYRDPANPLTYDAVPRMNLSLLLFFGYGGAGRDDLAELLRRGALTMLLTMSPTGEFPYGGRSNQQNFNEATAALIFEFEAARYKKEGNPALAGAFKRAARLSALSVRRWLDLRPVRFIKNEFPAESQHGRQKGYGYYGVYSLLIASQFGFAGLVADPSIEERPVPFESGTYAVGLDEDFHKVFASCSGYHLEIDTRADLHYDATGLGRLHKFGVPTETALSTPIVSAPEYLVSSAESPRNVSIGPGWEVNGRVHWLSDCSAEIGDVEFKTLAKKPEGVKFRLIYRGLPGCDRVVEIYEMGKAGVTVTYEVYGPADALLVQVPLILTDGSHLSRIEAGKSFFKVFYQGHIYEVSCLKPPR